MSRDSNGKIVVGSLAAGRTKSTINSRPFPAPLPSPDAIPPSQRAGKENHRRHPATYHGVNRHECKTPFPVISFASGVGRGLAPAR